MNTYINWLHFLQLIESLLRTFYCSKSWVISNLCEEGTNDDSLLTCSKLISSTGVQSLGYLAHLDVNFLNGDRINILLIDYPSILIASRNHCPHDPNPDVNLVCVQDRGLEHKPTMGPSFPRACCSTRVTLNGFLDFLRHWRLLVFHRLYTCLLSHVCVWGKCYFLRSLPLI